MEATIVRPSSRKATKIKPTTGWQGKRSCLLIGPQYDTDLLPRRFRNGIRHFTRQDRLHLLWMMRNGASQCSVAREAGVSRNTLKHNAEYCARHYGVRL